MSGLKLPPHPVILQMFLTLHLQVGNAGTQSHAGLSHTVSEQCPGSSHFGLSDSHALTHFLQPD